MPDPLRHTDVVIHSPTLLVLLTVLTIARLTVLVNDDYLTAPVRAKIERRASGPLGSRPRLWRWLDYFVNCPWCVSMWLGPAVAAAVYAWHPYWPIQIGLVALAASYVTGMLAERRED